MKSKIKNQTTISRPIFIYVDGYGRDKKTIIQELVNKYNCCFFGKKIEHKNISVRDNNIWGIEYISSANPNENSVEEKSIFMIKINKERGVERYYGYKIYPKDGIGEFNCPLKLFKKAECKNSTEYSWRKMVLKKIVLKKQVSKLKIGDEVTLSDDCIFNKLIVCNVQPLILQDKDGVFYDNFSKKDIVAITIK